MIKNLNEEDEGTYVCQVRIGAFRSLFPYFLCETSDKLI